MIYDNNYLRVVGGTLSVASYSGAAMSVVADDGVSVIGGGTLNVFDGSQIISYST